ncbi:unnamed protein product [Ixodes hexagonus]
MECSAEYSEYTPPSSPRHEPLSCSVFEPSDVTVGTVFACHNDVHPKNVTCHIPLEAPYIRLFGRSFYRRRFSRHHLTELFWMARAQISELSAESRCHEIVISPSGIAKVRQDISIFFSYLRHEVDRLLDDPNVTAHVTCLQKDEDVLSRNEFCGFVLREIQQTLLCIGHICDMPQAATTLAPSSAVAALFHLCLEAWWSAFQVADAIASSAILKGSEVDVCFCDLSGFGQSGSFSQVAVILLWDLCCLASRSYRTNSVVASERRAFCCDCVRHLWSMVMDLIRRRQEHHGEEPFWTYMNFVLEALCSRSPVEPGADVGKFDLSSFARATNDEARTPGFCLWLLTSVAEIDDGCMWRKKGKSNYLMARRFVQSATANQGELDMRTVLKCCITLHRLWEPSLELLLPLLEFFLKNLNDSFQEPSKTTGIQGLVLWKTGQQLYQQAKLRTEADTMRSSESSFELFLILLARSLHKYSSAGATNLWRQLRGRIYSKFHTKKMQELTEMGLQNCSLLFLVLALSVELEEVVKKEFGLFEMLAASTSPSKLSVVMRGMFASLLALQEKGADLALSGQQVACWFFAHCLEKPGKGSDSSFLQQKAALLPLFLEGMGDIFDASPDLGRSEHVLLAPEFGQLLEQSSQSEQAAILRTFQDVIERVRQTMYSQDERRLTASLQTLCQGFSTAVYSGILQFVHRAVVAPIAGPPPQPYNTDTAVAVTLLALDLPSSTSVPVRANFTSLFEYFGCSTQVHPRVSCRFLCLVLSESDALEELARRIPNLETRLVQSWLRCCVAIVPPCDQMTKLSGVVLELKELNQLLLGTLQRPDSGEGHDVFATRLFASLAEANDILSDVGDTSGTIRLQQSLALYLQDFVVTVAAVLKSASPTSAALQNVYKICGQLFKHCSTLLYSKGLSGCLLPQLLDCLVVPSVVHAKRPLPQAQLMALKHHLPQFLDGLLSFRIRLDPYLLRRIRDIITHYLSLFSLTQTAIYNTGPHPLLVVLDSGTGSRASQKRELYVSLLLDCICDNFIPKKGVAHAHFAQGLRFVQEVLKRVRPSQNEYGSIIKALLPALFENLLNSSTDAKLCRELVTQILRDCKDKLGTSEHGSLVETLSSFVSSNLAWSTSSVFRLLHDVATLHPQLVADAMSRITLAAQDVERKRGGGSDAAIRKNLSDLLSHVEKCRSAIGKT